MTTKAISSLAVGSSVYLNVGGVRTEFLIVHQGLPSSLYDTSSNGTWLLMKDIYEQRQWHSSDVNKLESSTIHSYLNSTFLNLFESDIKNAIKQVKIPYRQNGGQGGTDQSGANGLPAKVFLLSGYECGFTSSNISYPPVDGTKLSYFESGTGWSARSKRIAYLNGSAAYWWFRSPLTNSSSNVECVDTDGYPASRLTSSSFGVRPALVLLSNVLVDDSGNVVIPDLTAHKTLVNGTSYNVKGGKCLVNGTSYDIKKGRTLIGGTGYDITFAPSYDPVFANNTWEQIIAACHNNAVPDTWKVADQNTYFLTAEGEITLTGNILDAPEGCTDEEGFTWFAETGDFTEKGSSQSTSYDGVKKSIAKLWVRIEVAAGAEAKVLMQFDSDGKWVQAGQTLKPERKRSYYLPIVPRRADHYRIRIEGKGECRVYSMNREYYAGSELKSTRGPQ